MSKKGIVVQGDGIVVDHLTTETFNFGTNKRPEPGEDMWRRQRLEADSPAAAQAFVSHVSEHFQLAEFIGQFLENRFPDLHPVFIAGSVPSIPAGIDWFAAINAALRSARVLFVLADNSSLENPWINFEVGSAWTREIPIVCLCFNGRAPESLPLPYLSRQALSLSADDAESSLRNVTANISQLLEVQASTRLPLEMFAGTLKTMLLDLMD